MKLGIHIFRKDLRIIDNRTLYECYSQCDSILGVFILNKAQTICSKTKFFRSYNAMRFMMESLDDLNNNMDNKLWICELSDLLKFINQHNETISCISTCKDYTLYSTEIDKLLIDKTRKYSNIQWIATDGSFMTSGDIIKSDGTPYVVFSYFYKIAETKKVELPQRKKIKWKSPPLSTTLDKIHKNIQRYASPIQMIVGGRTNGLKILRLRVHIDYEQKHNKMATGTLIAPYLNFGCLSSSEVYYYWKYNNKSLVKKLYWRDFYLTIMKHNPEARKYAWLDPRYNHIKWRTKREFINEWNALWESRTGFHVIDAATRQLRTTGYLSNHVRMLWAWFCIKGLQINPFDETYGAISMFSRLLIDASTSQNKLNFEWIISTLDVGGRRYARGPALAGRYMDTSNDNIKKLQATQWMREWLTDEDLKRVPIFDMSTRYKQWIQRIKTIL